MRAIFVSRGRSNVELAADVFHTAVHVGQTFMRAGGGGLFGRETSCPVNSLIAMLQPVVKEWEPQVAANWMVNVWINDAISKRANEVAEQ